MISDPVTSPDAPRDFTAEGMEAVLREACEVARIDASGAELLRLGSNAVYRLPSAPVIVRIARDPNAAMEMERAVQVARWLESQDYPATRVLPGVCQPLSAGGRVVTFWESAQDREEYATVTEPADLLRRLHWLEQPESLRLPYFDPFAKVWSSFEALDGVSADDMAFLEQRARRLGKEYDRLDFVLPYGLIHGDAGRSAAARSLPPSSAAGCMRSVPGAAAGTGAPSDLTGTKSSALARLRSTNGVPRPARGNRGRPR
ncbi:phosphotransferase [Streptomyces sp. NPDC048650]|uniref:phosphotransferase n=1 Tax=Streptomyces sp. NPDC048650 TaxID=3365583 RepID=UPI0037150248